MRSRLFRWLPRPATRPAAPTRLSVEAMEDRRLPSGYMPDQVLIQFKPDTSPQAQAQARQAAGAVRAEFVRGGPARPDQAALEMFHLTPGRGVEEAVARLKAHPAVAFAEPNWVLTRQVADDPYYANGSLWGVYGDDQPAATGPAGTTNGFGSQAEKVWASGNVGSRGVYVGVIDEGIDLNHPDLKANVWVNPFDPVGDANGDGNPDDDGNGYADDTSGWDFFQNNNTIYDGSVGDNSTDSHGTHVAGTIGGAGGNGAGVAGVNWAVTIIAGKFLGPTGGSVANAVKAVDYFTDLKTRHGLNVVALNNSWGGGGYSQALHDAVIRAARQDILFVAAAGNGGRDQKGDNNDGTAYYPAGYDTSVGTSTEPAAGYDGVIAVAAIDRAGALAAFSNYGARTVDLGAPGVGVWSTTPNGTYSSFSGTSMATPHVTGAAALYAAARPGRAAATIKTAILDAARATPTASVGGKTLTGGRLNVTTFAAPAGVTVTPASGLSTTESGGTATFTVALASRPSADVRIGLRSSYTPEGVASHDRLVFTPDNWNAPQTVTVTGVDDTLADGDRRYSIVTAPAESSDPRYNGLDAADVSVTNIDNDTPGLLVTPVVGLVTTEARGTATFTVALASRPAAGEAVTVGLVSSNKDEGVVSTASLVFTPDNWQAPQTVTVTGVDDDTADGDAAYTVTLTAESGANSGYNGLTSIVSLTNQDNDRVGITVTPESELLYTTELGGTASFSVVLTSRPAADVVVGLRSSNAGEGVVSPERLVFTPANWNTPQTVTVTGVRDGVVDGDRAYAVVTAAAASADGKYNGLDAADVAVTNRDADTVTTTKTFASYDAGPIRDWARSGSRLVISQANNLKITDLNVSVDLTHGAVGDLIITLKSPAGTTVTLLNRRGGANQDLRVTFDDEAARAVSSYPVAGVTSYKPEKALSGFDGQNSAGEWWLYVEDRAANGKQGAVNSWSLTLNTGATSGATAPATGPAAGVSVVGLPAGPVAGSGTTGPESLGGAPAPVARAGAPNGDGAVTRSPDAGGSEYAVRLAAPAGNLGDVPAVDLFALPVDGSDLTGWGM